MLNKEELMAEAIEARKNAYVPYSHFKVGASAVAEDGRHFGGANIENASYGITMCAERNAIFGAACAGVRKITALAVVADTEAGVSPCGACRQAMTEFMTADTPVFLGNLHGLIEETTVGALLPGAFAKEDMHNA